MMAEAAIKAAPKANGKSWHAAASRTMQAYSERGVLVAVKNMPQASLL